VSHLTTSDGVALHYEDDGAGPVVVMLPGWTGSAGFFTPVDGLRTVRVDPRGHGHSDKPPHGHTVDRFAQDVHELIEALALEDVTLLGQSMGATVVLAYLRRHGSAHLGRVVLMSGAPRLLNDAGYALGIMDRAAAETWRRRLADGFAGELEMLVRRGFHVAPDAGTVRAMVADRLRCPPETAIAVTWDAQQQDFTALLPAIDVPLLAILGRHDPIVPTGNAEHLARLVPAGRAAVFEHSGHFPSREEPGRFQAELRAFVNQTNAW
jgi:pimeloyl-ACP methyl ester carboxylesterase